MNKITLIIIIVSSVFVLNIIISLLSAKSYTGLSNQRTLINILTYLTVFGTFVLVGFEVYSRFDKRGFEMIDFFKLALAWFIPNVIDLIVPPFVFNIKARAIETRIRHIVRGTSFNNVLDIIAYKPEAYDDNYMFIRTIKFYRRGFEDREFHLNFQDGKYVGREEGYHRRWTESN